MKNHSNSSRRQAKKGELARAISEAKRPSYSQVVEAKALARKLMGIPDLHSINYANKERKAVLRITRLISSVAIAIEKYSRQDWVLVGVHKTWLNSINRKIEASNEYRKRNNLLLHGIPEVLPIRWSDLYKIRSLVVVLQCRLCKCYLSNSRERRAEACSTCLPIIIETTAKSIVRMSTRNKTPLTMAKALIKARKLEETYSSNPPSFSTHRHLTCNNPHNSSISSTRGGMDMTHNIIAKCKRPINRGRGEPQD